MNHANVVKMMRRTRPAQSRSAVQDSYLNSWGTVLSVSFPEGTTRHPRVLDLIERNLGRTCAIDTGGNGVVMSFLPEGDSYASACQDSREVASHLLSILNLPAQTPVQIDVIEPGAIRRNATDAPVTPLPDLL